MGQNANGQLHRYIKTYPRKRISLEEMKEKCPDPEELQEQILALVNEGLLTPVKSSGTNGNRINPLYIKYNICIEKAPEVSADDIYTLHPSLLANGYLLRNKHQYVNNNWFLKVMSQWLTSHKDDGMMSRRERSLVIFGDEKMIDTHLKLIEGMEITDKMLCYYETPEECYSDYIPVRKPEMTLLICENKDIWFNIRRLMYEDKRCKLLGTDIDGVVYGQGNKITGKGNFHSYSRYLGAETLHILYCGDIDRAGFDMYNRFCNTAEDLDIRLFTPAYKKMLELSRSIALPNSDDERGIMPDMTDILEQFTSEEQAQIIEILHNNKRLPQEILSYPVLADNMR